MEKKKRLPMGLVDFKRIRADNFYYVDKTGLITDLIENVAKVNLFTRPRLFGKTLMMSTLKSFFEVGAERELFDGLAAGEESKLCDAYLGKYPVISISLKDAVGWSFAEAKGMLCRLIGTEAMRFAFLLQSYKKQCRVMSAALTD